MDGDNVTAGTAGGGLTFNRRSTVSLISKTWAHHQRRRQLRIWDHQGDGASFRDDKGVVAAPNRSNGWMLGAQVSAGPGYAPVSYTKVKDNSATGRRADQLAVGYVAWPTHRGADWISAFVTCSDNRVALKLAINHAA